MGLRSVVQEMSNSQKTLCGRLHSRLGRVEQFYKLYHCWMSIFPGFKTLVVNNCYILLLLVFAASSFIIALNFRCSNLLKIFEHLKIFEKVSVLGLLFFILYTSELFYIVGNHMAIYSDDTTIYAVIPRLRLRPQVIESLSRDLVAIHSSCLKLHLRLNPKKTKSMMGSRLLIFLLLLWA